MGKTERGGLGLKTQIVLFFISVLRRDGCLAAGVENLIEVLSKPCVWLACQDPA